jgi:hypothetical protein
VASITTWDVHSSVGEDVITPVTRFWSFSTPTTFLPRKGHRTASPGTRSLSMPQKTSALTEGDEQVSPPPQKHVFAV